MVSVIRRGAGVWSKRTLGMVIRALVGAVLGVVVARRAVGSGIGAFVGMCSLPLRWGYAAVGGFPNLARRFFAVGHRGVPPAVPALVLLAYVFNRNFTAP
jgi:hypothetical protein